MVYQIKEGNNGNIPSKIKIMSRISSTDDIIFCTDFQVIINEYDGKKVHLSKDLDDFILSL